MLIWVTRTAPDNLRTAHRLRALGHRSLVLPVLRVRKVEPAPCDGASDAIVFTSANAVRHHEHADSDFDVPVFAVGNHTLDAAAAAGYRTVTSANGDVGALFDLLRRVLPPGASVAHYCADETAGDLAGDMSRSGYGFERRVVYRTDAANEEQLAGVRAALAMVGGILIHSGKAAERVRALILATGWRGRVWCISRACALRFEGIRGLTIAVAAVPTEDGMFAMIPPTARQPAQRLRARPILPGMDRRAAAAGQTGANDNAQIDTQDAFADVPPANDGDDPRDPPPSAA